MKSLLKVVVNSPDKILWEGDAKHVISENPQGKFSIFPGHANFITTLDNQVIEVKPKEGEVMKYTFPYSVLYTHEDLVSIYTLL